jgi:hypothetical protein
MNDGVLEGSAAHCATGAGPNGVTAVIWWVFGFFEPPVYYPERSATHCAYGSDAQLATLTWRRKAPT